MNKALRFFPSVVDEGKKVIWPNRATVTNHSVMVLVTIIISTLIIAGIDYVFQQLLLLAINKG